MRFSDDYLRCFIGGTFDLEQPRTVGELRAALSAMDAELKKWGDDKVIATFWLDKDKQQIQVTLEEHPDFKEME
jgi:hypothetical protein